VERRNVGKVLPVCVPLNALLRGDQQLGGCRIRAAKGVGGAIPGQNGEPVPVVCKGLGHGLGFGDATNAHDHPDAAVIRGGQQGAGEVQGGL
jgi:hypothetical protein